ncbi:MAG TPA: M23 family metallopeptidase, partial [Gemmatimonadales bacterium]|nr:M23 family metallopeptidase [Gemmatimonadales bacterium]
AVAAAPGFNPRRLRVGQTFEFRYVRGGAIPERVRARLDDDRILWLRRAGTTAWSGAWEEVAWTPEPIRVGGAIVTSLYDALRAAVPDTVLPPGETDRLTYDLADNVFAWEVDFQTEVIPGDTFQLLFERLVSSENDVRYGRLVAATLQTRRTLRTAYVLSDGEGRNSYYDAGGRSLRRAFKRAPVPYRVTSRFSYSRFHPVLREYRAHLGTDYRAPVGTRVEATGDGAVTRAGRWGGYGIMVAIRHAKAIETRYAHLSRVAPGIRPGVRVRQGETIGYSGVTGLATAPHVHYEFLQNGRHKNPRSADVGNGDPVPAVRRAEFEALRYRYDRVMQGDAPFIYAASAR